MFIKAASVLPAYTATHDDQVLFTYVLAGSVRMDGQLMVAGDAFTLPPGEGVQVGDISSDAQALDLRIPGIFRTVV